MSSPIEICIYEVKLKKLDEFEILLNNISEHHKSFDGVIDVKYMK